MFDLEYLLYTFLLFSSIISTFFDLRMNDMLVVDVILCNLSVRIDVRNTKTLRMAVCILHTNVTRIVECHI